MVKLLRPWTPVLYVALALAGSFAPAAAAAPDRLLPEDTYLVFSLNVKQLVASEVVKKHALEQVRAAVQANPQIGMILSQLNYDPLKDLNSVTVAMAGNLPLPTGGGSPKVPDLLIIARGSFDLAKVSAVLGQAARNTPDKIATSTQGQVTIYETKEGDTPMFMAFLDKNTMIGSPQKSLVADAINKGPTGGSGRLKKEMMTALDKADANQTLWMAASIPQAVRDLMKANPQAAAIADKLESMTLGVMVRDNVVTELRIHTTDPMVARQLSLGIDQAKVILATMALQQKELGPDLADLITATKASAKDATVVIRNEISSELIEKAVKKAKEAQKK